MSDRSYGILGVFHHSDAVEEAVKGLRGQRPADITVYTPLPHHDIEHAMARPESPIRVFTLVGGLTGAATGFAMPIWMSLDWPLITGGKPIISLPPFVIIAFELTILFGALATVLGLFVNAFILKPKASHVYDPSFSAGTFGVFVVPAEGRAEEARAVLERAGATEIRSEAVDA
ncbi:MAG TPA: DUF3341 domain-containing protein [Longimicrobiales bacterium]|nr:DUF3341 domain-containing protein [Longimicrobiales bacterium]